MSTSQSVSAVLLLAGALTAAFNLDKDARADVTIVHETLPPKPQPVAQPPQAQVPAAQGQVSQGPDTNEVQTADQRDLDQLIEKQKKLQAAMGAVSGVLPGGSDVGSGASAGAMNVIVKNPVAANFANQMANTVQDPAFMKDAGEIMKNPNMKWMYGALIVYAIVFVFIRKLVMATSDRFLIRLFMSGSLFLVFIAGYLAISYCALGDPFLRVTQAIATAALKAVAQR